MGLYERIAEAHEAFVAVTKQTPNVVYLGKDEWREGRAIALAAGINHKTLDGRTYSMGMRVIRVKLSNYLQVAYVEGVE